MRCMKIHLKKLQTILWPFPTSLAVITCLVLNRENIQDTHTFGDVTQVRNLFLIY
jgi:hypothetical protein